MEIDSKNSPRPPQMWNQLWRLNLAFFALPCWLFVAPAFARWLWPQLASGPMPALLESFLGTSRLWVLLGLLIALGALSSDYKHLTTMQRAARWFVAGVCQLPLVACFLSLK